MAQDQSSSSQHNYISLPQKYKIDYNVLKSQVVTAIDRTLEQIDKNQSSKNDEKDGDKGQRNTRAAGQQKEKVKSKLRNVLLCYANQMLSVYRKYSRIQGAQDDSHNVVILPQDSNLAKANEINKNILAKTVKTNQNAPPPQFPISLKVSLPSQMQVRKKGGQIVNAEEIMRTEPMKEQIGEVEKLKIMDEIIKNGMGRVCDMWTLEERQMNTGKGKKERLSF